MSSLSHGEPHSRCAHFLYLIPFLSYVLVDIGGRTRPRGDLHVTRELMSKDTQACLHSVGALDFGLPQSCNVHTSSGIQIRMSAAEEVEEYRNIEKTSVSRLVFLCLHLCD